MEIDPESVVEAIRLGVPVIELDIDAELDDFADHSYDVVVLSRTVQTLHRPYEVLQHMGRIADRLIVSVPNFGYWRHRLRLLRGRMPMSRELPHAWYDTPNLRHTTLVELEELFARLGLTDRAADRAEPCRRPAEVGGPAGQRRGRRGRVRPARLTTEPGERPGRYSWQWRYQIRIWTRSQPGRAGTVSRSHRTGADHGQSQR